MKKKLIKAYKEWEKTVESKFQILGDLAEFHSLMFIVREGEGMDVGDYFHIGYEDEGKSLFFNTYLNGEIYHKSSKKPKKLNKWLKEINNY